MSIFEKKFHVSRGVYNRVTGLADQSGALDTGRLHAAADRAQRQLSDPSFAANRIEHGEGMSAYARELREVAEWVGKNPGVSFRIIPRN